MSTTTTWLRRNVGRRHWLGMVALAVVSATIALAGTTQLPPPPISNCTGVGVPAGGGAVTYKCVSDGTCILCGINAGVCKGVVCSAGPTCPPDPCCDIVKCDNGSLVAFGWCAQSICPPGGPCTIIENVATGLLTPLCMPKLNDGGG